MMTLFYVLMTALGTFVFTCGLLDRLIPESE